MTDGRWKVTTPAPCPEGGITEAHVPCRVHRDNLRTNKSPLAALPPDPLSHFPGGTFWGYFPNNGGPRASNPDNGPLPFTLYLQAISKLHPQGSLYGLSHLPPSCPLTKALRQLLLWLAATGIIEHHQSDHAQALSWLTGTPGIDPRSSSWPQGPA